MNHEAGVIHFGALLADRTIKGENVRSSRLSCLEMQELCCDRLNGRDPNRFGPGPGHLRGLTRSNRVCDI